MRIVCLSSQVSRNQVHFYGQVWAFCAHFLAAVHRPATRKCAQKSLQLVRGRRRTGFSVGAVPPPAALRHSARRRGVTGATGATGATGVPGRLPTRSGFEQRSAASFHALPAGAQRFSVRKVFFPPEMLAFPPGKRSGVPRPDQVASKLEFPTASVKT